MFSTTKLVKNNDKVQKVKIVIIKNSDADEKVKIVIKGKYVYSGSGIGFHRADSWSLENDIAENIVIIVHHLMLIIAKIFF